MGDSHSLEVAKEVDQQGSDYLGEVGAERREGGREGGREGEREGGREGGRKREREEGKKRGKKGRREGEGEKEKELLLTENHGRVDLAVSVSGAVADTLLLEVIRSHGNHHRLLLQSINVLHHTPSH